MDPASALLGLSGGYLYQDFVITEGSSLFYGAWFKVARRLFFVKLGSGADQSSN